MSVSDISGLVVNISTTPAQLAQYVQKLDPRACINARRLGENGEIMLYAQRDDLDESLLNLTNESRIIRNVAMEVVLQKVCDKPGAQDILCRIYEFLEHRELRVKDIHDLVLVLGWMDVNPASTVATVENEGA